MSNVALENCEYILLEIYTLNATVKDNDEFREKVVKLMRLYDKPKKKPDKD